jgi:tetratricopeptide (TPR) repeat protein
MTKIFSTVFVFSFSLLFSLATYCQQNSIIKAFESEDENFFLMIELTDEKPYLRIDRFKGESFLSQYNLNDYHNINWDNKKFFFPSKDSIESISKLTQIDPLNPKNFGLRANAYFWDGNFKDAVLDYSRALKLDSINYYYFLSRAQCRSFLEEYDGAISDFGKAIALDSNNSDGYFNRGVVYQFLDQDDLATFDFIKAIKIDPTNIEYYMQTAVWEASDLDKVIKINPNSSYAYNYRGNIKWSSKDYIGAIADYTKAIEIDPNFSDGVIYTNRANIKAHLNDYLGAVSDYTKAIDIYPNDAYTYFNRGLAYFELNDLRSACLDFKIAKELGEEIPKKYTKKCKP